MLKSTKEKMERQSERDSKVAFFEAQKRKSEKYENRNGGGYCQKTGNVPYL